MDDQEILRRQEEFRNSIARLEEALKSAPESERQAATTRLQQAKAAFRKFSIDVLKEEISRIDEALKRYAETRAYLEKRIHESEKQIHEIDELQKITVSSRALAVRSLRLLEENV